MARRPDHDHRRSLIRAALGASALTLAHRSAIAQEAWPAKPIRVIVPFPAGGVVDLVTRAVTDRLAVTLKQPFLVEARPGASLSTFIRISIVASMYESIYS